MRHLYKVTIIFIIVILVGVGTASAQTDTPTPTPSAPAQDITEDEAQDILREAQDANARSRDAIDTVNNMLSLIQGVGTIASLVGGFVTIALTIAAVLGFRNTARNQEEIRNQFKEFRELQERVSKLLDDTRREQDKVTANIAKLEHLQQSVETRFLQMQGLDERVNEKITTLEETTTIRLENTDARTENVSTAIALTQLAQQQIAINNLKAAAQTLERAAERDEENSVIQYFLGDVYVRLGEVDKSLDFLKKSMEEQQDYPDAEASYAYALRLQGDRAGEAGDKLKQSRFYDEAQDIFLKLYNQFPELLDLSGESVYGALASIYRRIDDIPKAIEWYKRVREITPLNSYPVNNLALMYYLDGQTDKSKPYFRQSLEIANRTVSLSPSNYWRWFDLITAKIALEADTQENILSDLDRVFELDPGEDPLSKLLDGLVELKKAPETPQFMAALIARVELDLATLRLRTA